MAKYKEQWPNPSNATVVGYLDTETNKHIPNAPGNKDYQIYANWTLGLDENGDEFDPPTGPQVADPAYDATEIADYEAEQQRLSDIHDATATYNIPAMSVAEREAMIDDAFDGVVAVPALIDVLYDLLRKMIVYI